MKKKFRFLITAGFLFILSGTLLAQDFTVKIPSTDDYLGYLKPVKAGKSCSLKINVTNNLSVSCTVSIDKNKLGTVMSWVSIDNNSQTVAHGATVTFNLTIKVPANTAESNYVMWS